MTSKILFKIFFSHFNSKIGSLELIFWVIQKQRVLSEKLTCICWNWQESNQYNKNHFYSGWVCDYSRNFMNKFRNRECTLYIFTSTLVISKSIMIFEIEVALTLKRLFYFHSLRKRWHKRLNVEHISEYSIKIEFNSRGTA